jgi:hypothetical protein
MQGCPKLQVLHLHDMYYGAVSQLAVMVSSATIMPDLEVLHLEVFHLIGMPNTPCIFNLAHRTKLKRLAVYPNTGECNPYEYQHGGFYESVQFEFGSCMPNLTSLVLDTRGHTHGPVSAFEVVNLQHEHVSKLRVLCLHGVSGVSASTQAGLKDLPSLTSLHTLFY